MFVRSKYRPKKKSVLDPPAVSDFWQVCWQRILRLWCMYLKRKERIPIMTGWNSSLVCCSTFFYNSLARFFCHRWFGPNSLGCNGLGTIKGLEDGEWTNYSECRAFRHKDTISCQETFVPKKGAQLYLHAMIMDLDHFFYFVLPFCPPERKWYA